MHKYFVFKLDLDAVLEVFADLEGLYTSPSWYVVAKTKEICLVRSGWASRPLEPGQSLTVAMVVLKE